ncbi:MAG TPA: hypothetical protein VFW98_18720 [Gemmatimonadaceae bacterium]|nr:hypothetical protein [Gemmatimonadaceae bacterium]
MVNYYELGPDKRLNEIVVAGSHDAGITGGGGNVRTQALNIGQQAKAGVRVFDLRIAAATVKGPWGTKGAELRAFHADGKLMKNESKTRKVADVGRSVTFTRTKLSGGAFGMGLTKMLADARAFVESDGGKSEFLLLKFDKCLNWPLIAEACIGTLGSTIYRAGGNLNTTQLKDLKGKVIVLFSKSGVAALQGAFKPSDGILSFRNLYSDPAYAPNFNGLQYYGKGGTAVTKPFKKTGQNEKKQLKIMQGASFMAEPDVIRMMYWTTTGIFESIKKRNAKMWDPPNIVRLKRLWAQGLEEHVTYVNPLTAPPGSSANGPLRKRSMPNIVMIDFADDFKCQTIRGLNDATESELASL